MTGVNGFSGAFSGVYPDLPVHLSANFFPAHAEIIRIFRMTLDSTIEKIQRIGYQGFPDIWAELRSS